MDGELIPILTEEFVAGIKLLDDEDVADINTNSKLSLNQENVAELVLKAGVRPIHVLSIVGHPKEGKTLLAGYFVRCLVAAEQDESNWMDWENPGRKQTEVQWKTGRSPSSPGIWAFPRPFIVPVEEGESTGKEVAVILLYAQLSEHDQRSAKTISTLLSHSSSVIYNAFKDLDGKSFSAITQGISAAPEVGPKLTILLRDWRHPTDFPFGFQGGTSFLKEKLKINRRHSSTNDANRNREIFANYFQNKSCFLLPFPGDKVVSPGFFGSISEMESKFAKRLQEFVSELTNSDEISQILRNSEGKAVSAMEWKNGLVQFCGHYGKQNRLSRASHSMMNLTSELSQTEQKEYLKRSMQKYSEVWKKRARNADFLSEAEIQACHKNARKAALEQLRQLFHPEMESDEDDESTEMETKLSKQLKKEIKNKFQEMENLNAEKRKMFIQENMEESIEEFSKSLQQIFLGGNVIEEKQILQMSNAMITNAIENFRKTFASDDEENQNELGDEDDDVGGATSPTVVLQQKLEQVRNNLLSRPINPNPSGLLQQQNHDFTPSTYSSRETLSGSIGHSSRGFQIDASSNEESKTSRRFQIDESSDEELKTVPGTSHFNMETIKQDSTTTIHPRKATIDVKSISKEADALISKYVEEYKSKLNLNGKEISRQRHAENVEEFQQKFQSAFTSEADRSHLHRYLSKLSNQLETAWSTANLQISRAEKEWQSKLEQEMWQIVTAFEAELRKLLSEEKSMGKVKLQKLNESLLQKQLKRLNDFVKQSNSSSKISHGEKELPYRLDELKTNLENIRRKIEAELEEKRHSELNQIKLIEDECLKNYKRSMDSILTPTMTSVALKAEHEKYLNNAEETFEKKNKGKANASSLGLKQKIMETFSKLQKKHEATSVSRRAEINEILIKSRQIYDDEMVKHFQNHEFITDEELQKIHARSSKKAIDRCEIGGSLGAEDRADLEEFLNQAFIKFDEKNKMNLDIEPAIGIDLGTTYSCVAVYAKGQVKIIPNSIGKLTTPSYVAFSEDGRTLIGEPAKLRAYENPENTIFDAKRLIGRKFDDPKVQEDLKLWPFSVVDDRNIPKIEVNGKALHPEEISARLLKQLKKDAEEFLNCKITKAVITVPAYFNDGQRQATIDAGKLAGLKVLSVLNEPVAAAIAYNLQHSYGSGTRSSRNVIIFDLGGGTFDVAVLKITQGEVEVLAVEGDTHLGGEDFDKKTMAYCADEFKKKEAIDLFQGKDSPNKLVRDDARRKLKRLQADCEQKKIQLTNSRSAEVAVDSIHEKKDLSVKIRRATFEEFCGPLFKTTLGVVEKALKSAKLGKTEIDDIVLVGGSTRIPKLQQMLKEFFNGKDLCSSINPDEAVAYGAAVQAAILNGKIAKGSKHFNKIQDVTPMSIGVEVYGGAFSVIIPKGTKIPVKAQERYRTAHNNQTSVQVTIYQGENMRKAVCNDHLGDFYLNGIPPKAAGVENIDVEMVISSQGILHVNAAVTSTGKTNKITVTENKQRMSRATIQRLLPEA